MGTTIIDDVMARPIRNKVLSKSVSFVRDIVAQNVEQRDIKGDYVALPHRKARFSTEEHNEHR